MSLLAIQDRLDHNPQSLQRKAGMGDVQALAQLGKIVKAKKMAQMQQGLAQNGAQPTVKEQLMAQLQQAQPQAPLTPQPAAMQEPQPQPSGIAAATQDTAVNMAEGGFVQRRFDFGGEVDTDSDTSPFARDMSGVGSALGSAGDWFKDKSAREPETPEERAANEKALQTQAAMRGKSFGETVADYFRKPSEVKARIPYVGINTAPAGVHGDGYDARTDEAINSGNEGLRAPKPIGIASSVPTKGVTPPVRATQTPSGIAKGAPAAKKEDPKAPTPDDKGAHSKSLDALLEQLTPLQKAQVAQFQAAQEAENTRYTGAQAAKKNPDKVIAAMEDIMRITHPYSHARVGARGNWGALADGGYELSQSEQALRVQQAKEDAAHQAALLGIQAGLTKEQIAQLTGNYDLTNKALAADDKSELNSALAAARQHAADAAMVRAEAAATKAARSGSGAGGPKPMTYAQALTFAQNHANAIMRNNASTGANDPVPDVTTLAQQLFQSQGKALQSAAPAAPAQRIIKY